MLFIPIVRISLWFLIIKKRRLLCEIVFVPINKRTLIPKNGGKRSFSFETKASLSFILIKRLCLWCPILKGKKIIMWIHVYPNWQTNFDSKKWWEIKFFLWNQSINSFIQIKKMSLWCPIMKREEIIIWIYVYLSWQMNFDSKKLWEEKFFLWNQSTKIIYPNKENEFIVPNHKKKADYYANKCLSQLTDKL